MTSKLLHTNIVKDNTKCLFPLGFHENDDIHDEIIIGQSFKNMLN